MKASRQSRQKNWKLRNKILGQVEELVEVSLKFSKK
jgi:hypothetical protein